MMRAPEQGLYNKGWIRKLFKALVANTAKIKFYVKVLREDLQQLRTEVGKGSIKLNLGLNCAKLSEKFESARSVSNVSI